MKHFLLAAVFSLTAQIAAAVTLGDDGLHKTDWMRDTFKDLREDLAEANALGLDLMVIIEQRGCIYCTRMHEETFPDPEINAYLHAHYFVVQINMYGDTEVTDFDGTTLSEKDMVSHWRMLFAPTILFFPHEVADDASAPEAAAAMMPGAFGRYTTLNMLTWVHEAGYLGDESFQRYHARMLETQLPARD
ncbi:MAG: thioredoxin fold domain-containing protein [Rhodobacteraceae bacterium]|nr:thioredoxin fold domain-containing protein [Paracoccaceae bacterium]